LEEKWNVEERFDILVTELWTYVLYFIFKWFNVFKINVYKV
jgi:hypothetical protein